MLYPDKVKMLVDFIRPYVKEITMFTALPPNLNHELQKFRFKELLNRLDGCNISIGSAYPNTAMDIMGMSKPNTWRQQFVRELIKDGYADKFRVSFCLVKKHIEFEHQVKMELMELAHWGVKYIKINELTHKPDLHVGIKDIWPDLKLGPPISSGCSTFLKGNKWPKDLSKKMFKGIKILVKRGCAMVDDVNYTMTNSEKLKLIIRNVRDYLKGRKNYKVIYNDGLVTNSW